MANLKVKIQEDIILGNQDYGSKRTLEISSIDEIYKRIVTCPANAETTVVHFKQVAGAAGGATKFDGALDIQDVRYIRVTNLDASNSLTISLQIEVGEYDSGADTSASILLEAGKSFITRDEKFGSLKEDPSFALAGADLLLPELTKQVGIRSLLANPFGRLARGFTPLGIGLQGIELINQARKEQRRIDAMSPEEREDFIAEQESLLDFSA